MSIENEKKEVKVVSKKPGSSQGSKPTGNANQSKPSSTSKPTNSTATAKPAGTTNSKPASTTASKPATQPKPVAAQPKVETKPEVKVAPTKPEPKVEVKPEVKPESKVEPKVEVKPEVKPEPIVEVKEETKPESVVESKPEPKVEVKEEVKSEPVVESKPEVKPEIKEEVKSEPVVETKSEVKPEIKEETKAEVKIESKPEVKPEPKVEVKPEVKPEPKAEVKPEQKPVSKPTVQPASPSEDVPPQQNTKKIFLAAAVLTGLCLVFGVILVLVNSITEPTIEKARIKKIQDQCIEIYGSGIAVDDKIYSSKVTGTISQVIEVKKGGTVQGIALIGEDSNQYGLVSLLVGVDTTGAIKKIKTLTFQQTMGQADNIKKVEALSGSISGYNLGTTNGTTYSYNSIDKILKDGAKVYNSISSNFSSPTDDAFGKGYTVSELIDISGFTSSISTITIEEYKTITGTSNGKIIKVKITSYPISGIDDYSGPATLNATIELTLDASNKVIVVTSSGENATEGSIAQYFKKDSVISASPSLSTSGNTGCGNAATDTYKVLSDFINTYLVSLGA